MRSQHVCEEDRVSKMSLEHDLEIQIAKLSTSHVRAFAHVKTPSYDGPHHQCLHCSVSRSTFSPLQHSGIATATRGPRHDSTCSSLSSFLGQCCTQPVTPGASQHVSYAAHLLAHLIVDSVKYHFGALSMSWCMLCGMLICIAQICVES